MADTTKRRTAAESEAELRGALTTVAAVIGESCEAMHAMCSATLALIGTDASPAIVAQMLLNLGDALDNLSSAVSSECEAQGCGFVSRRLGDVLARLDAAKEVRHG
jgi:hypothetical protein